MKRNTRQKQAILECFKQSKRPLSAPEIVKLAEKIVPNINLATVYRNLKSLVEEDVLVSVEVPGQPPRYEYEGLEHHHHFLCQTCNRLFDVKGCIPGLPSLVPSGFQLIKHGITLYGLCDQCTIVQKN